MNKLSTPTLWVKNKHLLTLIFFLSLGMNLFAAPEVIQIGGTDYSTSDMGTKPAPIDANQKYGLCQLLYKQSEIGSVENANITKLAFYWKQGAYALRNVDIYISHSNLTKLTGFVNVTAANKVYSGSSTKKITMPSSSGWYEITLDSPFAWNGTDNIIITIDDNTGSWWSGSNTASVHYSRWSNNANNVAYIYNSSSTNYDPTSATTYTATISAYSPSIKLTFEASATIPDVPSNLAVSATTTTSATLSWSAVSGATSYDFQQSANGSDWSDLASGATGTSYNWTGLSAASTQYARIRATNAAGSSDWSDAVMVTTDAEHIHDGITFNKWASTTSLPTSGDYYINENMNFEAYSTDVITLTGNLNLCLNGKTVNMEAARIVVPEGKTLAIYDNVGGGKITSFVASEVGAFDIYAKALIVVYNGAELDLHQGTIENTYIPDEDGQSYAIYSNGTLHLSGDVLINSNDADIYLHESRVITLDGALTNAEKHTIYKNDGVITSGWSTYMGEEDPRDYFESANSAKSICLSEGEAALQTLLTLSETALNSAINSNDGQIVDVNLTRPLVASQYNTFCLPFALTADQMEEYYGAEYELWELESSSLDGEQLSLAFERKYALEAGKPYLLQPADDVSSVMFFDDMTIEKDLSNTVTSYVDFKGVYGTTSLEGGNRNLLFLGAGNELFYPAEGGNNTIKGFRAYFEVKPSAGAAKRARIVKKEEGATGMDQITNDKSPMTNKILRNGQLLILRDNKTYNVLGMEYK